MSTATVEKPVRRIAKPATRTTLAKVGHTDSRWYIVDAAGKNLGWVPADSAGQLFGCNVLIPKQFSDDEAMIAFRDKGLNIAICKYYKEHHKQNNSTGRRTTRCGLSRCSNEGWPSCRE